MKGKKRKKKKKGCVILREYIKIPTTLFQLEMAAEDGVSKYEPSK